MQYHCQRCDLTFEFARAEGARCPKCLRASTVAPLDIAGPGPKQAVAARKQESGESRSSETEKDATTVAGRKDRARHTLVRFRIAVRIGVAVGILALGVILVWIRVSITTWLTTADAALLALAVAGGVGAGFRLWQMQQHPQENVLLSQPPPLLLSAAALLGALAVWLLIMAGAWWGTPTDPVSFSTSSVMHAIHHWSAASWFLVFGLGAAWITLLCLTNFWRALSAARKQNPPSGSGDGTPVERKDATGAASSASATKTQPETQIEGKKSDGGQSAPPSRFDITARRRARMSQKKKP
jgi:hypothetical protein